MLHADLVRPLAESMDKNGDGELDVEEFRGALLQHTGITVRIWLQIYSSVAAWWGASVLGHDFLFGSIYCFGG